MYIIHIMVSVGFTFFIGFITDYKFNAFEFSMHQMIAFFYFSKIWDFDK